MSVRKMMISKVRAINYKKLNYIAKLIAKNNNKSSCYVKRDMIVNFLKYGIGYTDYLKGDYINLTKEEKDTFITTKSYYKLIEYLNPRSYRCIFSNKIIFNKVFKEYIKRDFIDIRNITEEEFSLFLKGKKYVFAKPLIDFGGHGIEKIDVKSVQSPSILLKSLLNKKLYLVEEEIIQHSEMNKLNPFAVNVLRVVTLVKDGKSYIMGTAVRINLSDGILVGSDDAYGVFNEKGKLITPIVDDLANEYEEHPIAKTPFKSVKLPYIKEGIELAKKCSLVVPEIRYVGWDIAITEEGPIIIEGNEYPSYGLLQYYKLNNSKVGHLKQIKDVLGEELKNIKL